MSCRNPECRNGFTPGIVTSGKGTANAPILGAVMRWGWVNCRACKPNKDHPYQQVNRSPGEVAERARLADSKAKYENQAPPNRSRLEGLAKTTPAPVAPSAASQERLDRLLDQVSKLTDQVTELLAENRELRAEIARSSNHKDVVEVTPPEKPARRSRKKGGSDEVSTGTKGRRTLS